MLTLLTRLVRQPKTWLAAGAIMVSAQAPYPADPFFHIRQASRSTVDCGGRPISLDGSHTSTTLQGECPAVQVAGEHNDIFVPIAPGGTIQIVAPHNDVTWVQTRRGPPPRLLATAPSNSFHAR